MARARYRILLQPDIQEKFLKLLAAGVPIDTACRQIGISRAAYYAALRKAKARPNSEWGELAREFERVEAEAEVRLTAQWQKQCANDWRAAMSYLSKRWPERWGDQVRLKVEASKAVDDLLDKLEGALTPELYLTVLQAIDRVTEDDGSDEETP